MVTSAQKRFQELQSRFTELDGELPNTTEKEALSILHAMIQESLRLGQAAPAGSNENQSNVKTFEEIANLYKEAPGMGGEAENSGLSVGTKAPDFALPDVKGNLVRLSDYEGKNLVLVFYPLDWSPGCSDQLSLYQQELGEFEKANAQMIGISVDSIYSHGAWTAVRNLSIPLLADFHPKGEVARKYCVMRESDGFTERAIFIIDLSGIIRYSHVSPKLDDIPDIYELLDQLHQLEPSSAGSA
jgi:peroxiredoxin